MAITEQNLSDRTYFSLLRTLGVIRRVVDPLFAEFGITGAQWGVLRVLSEDENSGHPGGLRLSEVGDRLLIRPPSVTTVVDKLQRMRLVARAVDAADQRATRLSLTEEGRSLAKRLSRRHEKRVAEMMDGLKQRERVELNALLQRLTQHLETLSGNSS